MTVATIHHAFMTADSVNTIKNNEAFLSYLSLPVEKIKGVGKNYAEMLRRLAGNTILDLIYHLPTHTINRKIQNYPNLLALENEIVTFEYRVLEHVIPRNSKAPYRIFGEHNNQGVMLSFFNLNYDYLGRIMPNGETRIISGKVELYEGKVQIVHPDYMLHPDNIAELPPVQPIYPLTYGLTLKMLAKFIKNVIEDIPDYIDWIDTETKETNCWKNWLDCLKDIHLPQTDDMNIIQKAKERLAFDEMLSQQYFLHKCRHQIKKEPSYIIESQQNYVRQFVKMLPYKLTNDQVKTTKEILADMQSGERMFRLVQGDVGSGKTFVAFMAMLQVADSRMQSCIIAPTDILARQHLATMQPFADAIGVKIDILTGREKGKKRSDLLQKLAIGDIDILIGTHALLEDDVCYKNLGLVVIDEQHRFGVEQRLKLSAKNAISPHILVMSATPIPRTLAQTHYGDMDISIIAEKPAGRKEVQTSLLSQSRIDELMPSIQKAVQDDNRIYWICPLVDESEKIDLVAVTERYQYLSMQFGDAVSLVHGKMSSKEKEQALLDFSTGVTKLLVSTTVIEVGVNVPEAGIIIIEQPERFGLAQLHQLRGRIGRGDKQANCVLLYGKNLNENSVRRLKALRESSDGFALAEHDFLLRGGGDIMGTRQSGLPDYKIFNIYEHQHLLSKAIAYLKNSTKDQRLAVKQNPFYNRYAHYKTGYIKG